MVKSSFKDCGCKDEGNIKIIIVVHMFRWSLINSFTHYFDGLIKSVPFQDYPIYTVFLKTI